MHTAVDNYLECLTHGDKFNTQAVFRICSLWFGNPSDVYISRAVKKKVDEIATYKWVTLVYQIVSRMGEKIDDFQKTLMHLIEKMTIDHPYHCLYQLFALRNGDKVDPASKNQYKVDEDKQKAAERKN